MQSISPLITDKQTIPMDW